MKKTQSIKRILSLLLCMAMLLALFPVSTVFATTAESLSYTSYNGLGLPVEIKRSYSVVPNENFI